MRSAIESRLNRAWYGAGQPGWLLRALSFAYGVLSAGHRKLARLLRARDLDGKPIIVVGNLAAGGSGKTPLVIRLCELALECGLKPGVVSRGYGRSHKRPLRVSAQHSAAEAGDEPLLIARRCGVPVQVDANRERAARSLFDEGVDIVIADDGLQRLSLPRAVELCVVDGHRGLGNGRLLPAGPLREPASRLGSVDYVVRHGGPQRADRLEEDPAEVGMSLEPGPARRLEGEETMGLDAVRDAETESHAVAGIADPERFFGMLSGLGIRPVCHPFPDHHRFSANDFDVIPEGAMILMTEKDAVKCAGLGLRNAWYVPVDAVLDERFEKALRTRLRALVPSRGDGAGDD